MRRALLALAMSLVVGACAIQASGAEPSLDAGATPTPTADATLTADPTPTADATPTDDPAPTAPPTTVPAPDVVVPLVPITAFWSTEASITRGRLAAALAGTGSKPRQVFVSAADLAALAANLGVRPGSNVHAKNPADVRAAVAATKGSLGIVRAEDVTAKVHALAVGGVSLFGGSRVRDLARWPLAVREPAGPGAATAPSTFDAARTWTLVAGGDVMLDRSVYRRAITQKRGVDYPWAGGIARVTARFCCGWPGMTLVRAKRVTNNGAVRTLLRRADLAVVNLEGPVPDRPVHRMYGLVFSMDKRLLAGVRNAGIDAVSLANNHVLNAGRAGLLQTLRNVDNAGLVRFGAGHDLAAARRPAWFTEAGVRVAFLGYNDIGPAPNASARRAGAAPMSLAVMRSDIRAARRHGADVVIVMPHFGSEYTASVTARQRAVEKAALGAGADLVLGNHSHWAGPIALRSRARLVVYSMGDLLFDLNHDERTQEAVLVEATFVGKRLVQVSLRPTVIVDQAQLNLLTPAGGGSRLLSQIRAASERVGGP